MSRPEWRSRWKRAVFARRPGFTRIDARSGDEVQVPAMSDASRVLLLHLLDKMDANGYVSVPRAKLAKELEVPTARVSERVKLARQHGLLTVIRSAHPGTTAVYQSSIPASPRGTAHVPLEVRLPVSISGTPDVPQGGVERHPMSDLEVRQPIPHCRETPTSDVQAVDADEFVVQKSSRNSLESQRPGALDYMNRTGRWPGQSIDAMRYASGGLVSSAQPAPHVSVSPNVSAVVSLSSRDVERIAQAVRLGAAQGVGDQGRALLASQRTG